MSVIRLSNRSVKTFTFYIYCILGEIFRSWRLTKDVDGQTRVVIGYLNDSGDLHATYNSNVNAQTGMKERDECHLNQNSQIPQWKGLYKLGHNFSILLNPKKAIYNYIHLWLYLMFRRSRKRKVFQNCSPCDFEWPFPSTLKTNRNV